MNAKNREEVENIKMELRSILSELESIKNGVRSDFKGVGSEVCAKKLQNVVDRLSKARGALGTMDTKTLSPEYCNLNDIKEESYGWHKN